MPSALGPLPPIAQVRPLYGYTDIGKIERRINTNTERMINANMKKVMRIMIEQFSQL